MAAPFFGDSDLYYWAKLRRRAEITHKDVTTTL